MAVIISDVMRGPFGDIQPNVIITMRALWTSARVLISNTSSVVTDATGKYSMTVFPGEYEVTVSTLGVVGTIRVLSDSVNGTLNDFLIGTKPDDLTPEVVRTVDTFRSEAAASATAAKTSETNAAAAMSNALSKTVTTDQSVASTVLLTKPVRLSSAASVTGFIPSTQGAWVSWNRKTATDDGLTGATDFINHKGTLNGGWHFWSTDGTSINLSTRINWDGSIKTMGGIYSYTDQIMQAGSTAPNLLLRFRDKDGVEKGAVYSQTDTGVINFRWAGTTYTMQGRADGFVSVPKGHTIATALATPAAVVDAVSTISNSPVSFRGADAANFDVPNNYSIGTWYGFSVVPTISTVSPGVEQGKPVFYVNARTGNTYALNGLYVGSNPVALKALALGNKDLNTVTDEGDHYQPVTANATAALNYPISSAGVLRVLKSKASSNSREAVNQIYYPWHVADYYYSRVYIPSTDVWSAWEIFDSRSKNDARYLQIGAYGLGADYRPSLTGYTLASDYRVNGAFYANVSAMTDTFDAANNHVLNIFGYSNRTYGFQVAFPFGTDKMAFRRIQNNGVGAWKELWHNGNTTVDANGFIKKASPIVKLFGDGQCELNDQSQGVTTERISEGVYRVSGTLGFNSDGAWGGAGNGIEIPVDDNKRALVWVESKVLPDGDIEIRTYHRTYDTGPYSARNIEAMDSGEVYKKSPIFVPMPDGTPHDIPAGRWIDLRVEMPASNEPEPELEPMPEEETTSESEQPAVTEPEPEAIAPELEQPTVTEPESGEGANTEQNDESKE